MIAKTSQSGGDCKVFVVIMKDATQRVATGIGAIAPMPFGKNL
jgi:hypothetical protein